MKALLHSRSVGAKEHQKIAASDHWKLAILFSWYTDPLWLWNLVLLLMFQSPHWLHLPVTKTELSNAEGYTIPCRDCNFLYYWWDGLQIFTKLSDSVQQSTQYFIPGTQETTMQPIKDKGMQYVHLQISVIPHFPFKSGDLEVWVLCPGWLFCGVWTLKKCVVLALNRQHVGMTCR